MNKYVATTSCPVCGEPHLQMKVITEYDPNDPSFIGHNAHGEVIGFVKCQRFGSTFLYTEEHYPMVSDFVKDFSKALKEQLDDDFKRWGHTWLKRPKAGQEDRAYETFMRYKDEFDKNGTPIPWLKIAGEAIIAWVREKYPYIFP